MSFLRRLSAALLVLPCLALPLRADSAKTIDKAALALADQILKGWDKPKANAAVMPFDNGEGQATTLGQMVANSLAKAVVASGKIKASERKDLDKIYQEWKLNTTGAISPESTQKIGNLTGAEYMLIGTLQKAGKKEMIFYAKLVKTETAEIARFASVTVKADPELLSLNRALETGQETAGDAVVLSEKGRKGCTWVESSAVVRFGDEETKGQARARALARAREKAVAAALGQETAGFADFSASAFREQSQLVSEVLAATRYGRVQEEEIKEEGVVNSPQCQSCSFYRVLERVCVSPPRRDMDAGFQANVSLNRNEFLEGDEAQATLTSSREAYVYLVSVDKDWNAALAFPNSLVGGNRIQADNPFVYPNPEHRKAGIRLVAELPEGAPFSAETFRLLATKQPVPDPLWKGKYNRLLDALDDAGIDWTEAVTAFTIRKK